LTTQAEQLAREMASQATTIEDLNGLMRAMMKSALERMLNAEMDHPLRSGPPPAGEAPAGDVGTAPAGSQRNRRNGHSRKTVQGEMGSVTLDTPRDRNGRFEPQLIAKHQRRIPGFDEKILALCAKGMTTRDIQEIVQDLSGVEVSPTLVSEITADLDQEVTAWRTRRLDPVWPITYLDGIVMYLSAFANRYLHVFILGESQSGRRRSAAALRGRLPLPRAGPAAARDLPAVPWGPTRAERGGVVLPECDPFRR
jgi:putative transposase